MTNGNALVSDVADDILLQISPLRVEVVVRGPVGGDVVGGVPLPEVLVVAVDWRPQSMDSVVVPVVGPGGLVAVVAVLEEEDWSVSEEVTGDWFAPLPLGQRLVPAQWAGLRDKAFVQTVVSESVDIQPGGTGGVLTPVAGRIRFDVRW